MFFFLFFLKKKKSNTIDLYFNVLVSPSVHFQSLRTPKKESLKNNINNCLFK